MGGIKRDCIFMGEGDPFDEYFFESSYEHSH